MALSTDTSLVRSFEGSLSGLELTMITLSVLGEVSQYVHCSIYGSIWFWLVYQLDVKNVFLRGTLTEIMYCNQQIVFVDSAHLNIVCKLNKSLYDLKHAP